MQVFMSDSWRCRQIIEVYGWYRSDFEVFSWTFYGSLLCLVRNRSLRPLARIFFGSRTFLLPFGSFEVILCASSGSLSVCQLSLNASGFS